MLPFCFWGKMGEMRSRRNKLLLWRKCKKYLIRKKFSFFKTNGRFLGCGTCPDGDYDCFDCRTQNCNTPYNFRKSDVMRCYESNGKITNIKARKCDKKICYIASTLEG